MQVCVEHQWAADIDRLPSELKEEGLLRLSEASFLESILAYNQSDLLSAGAEELLSILRRVFATVNGMLTEVEFRLQELRAKGRRDSVSRKSAEP